MKSRTSGIWLTNISNKDIYLPDLGIKVCSMTSINILSNKPLYSVQDIEDSINKGSIAKNKNKIFVRFSKPEKLKPSRADDTISNQHIPDRARSTEKIVEQVYEELQITDDIFELDGDDSGQK